MVEYSKVNVKLSDTQLKKLKTAVKNKTWTTLRYEFKNASWKLLLTWIVIASIEFIIDNKTKNEAKKCI